MSDLVGQVLGPYRILAQIGQGGMATVFKAHQPDLDRFVALKVLPAHFQHDPAFAQRFEQEARIIARLEHPHILPVYDFGVSDGTSYIAMRLLTAGSIKDLLATRGALPPGEIGHLFYQIADALDYAHSQGVIHRDVKPSNVLLDPRGDTFLSDFGIAKMVAGSSQLTGTDVIGTPSYMSPEQGMATKLDGRSDVYSLGVMLCELLTGHVPYDADSPMGVILKHLTAPLPALRAQHPEIPDALERVVHKAMAKDPQARYATAGEMAQALAEALGNASSIHAVRLASLPRAPTQSQVAGALPNIGAADEATMTTPPSPATPSPASPAAGGPAASGVGAISSVPEGRSDRPTAASWLAAAGRSLKIAPTPLAAGLLVVGLLVLLWAAASALGVGAPGVNSTATPPALTPEPTTGASLPPGFAGGTWANFGDANEIRALAAGPGTIWSAGPGGLVRWDAASGASTVLAAADGLPANDLSDVLVDRGGAVWIATFAAGVARVDLAGTTPSVRTFTTADGLDSNHISKLYEDADGTLWAFSTGSRLAAHRFTGSGWQPVALAGLASELPAIRDAYRQADGTFWLATDGAGLVRVQTTEARSVVISQNDGLPSNHVTALAPAGDSGLWVGTDAGLVRLAAGRVEPVAEEGVGAFATTDLLVDKGGHVWVAGGTGVYELNPSVGEWRQHSAAGGLPAMQVSALALDTDGRVWLGTPSGVARRVGETWEALRVPHRPATSRFSAILPWRDGLLLLAEENHQLIKMQLDGPEFTAVAEFSRLAVDTVAVAPDGTLYAMAQQGLYRLDPGAASPARVSVPGIPGGVTVLVVSADGTLWAGGDSGVSSYAAAGWTPYAGAGAPPRRPITALAAGPDGATWVGWEGGLARYLQRNWDVWEAGRELPAGTGAFTTLAPAPGRGAFAATREGLVFEFANGRWRALGHSLSPPVPINALAVAMPESAGGEGGAVWAATDGGGVARLEMTNSSGTREWATARAGSGLGDDVVTAVYVAPGGDVWLATGAGLAHWMPGGR